MRNAIVFLLCCVNAGMPGHAAAQILTQAQNAPDNFAPFLTGPKDSSLLTTARLKKILLPVLAGGREVAQAYLLSNENGEVLRVEPEGLREWALQTLSPEALTEFDALASSGKTLAVGEASLPAFILFYDENEAALKLEPVPAALKKNDVSLQYDGISEFQAPLAPATVSGFVNFRAGQDYVHSNMLEDGRDPARLDLDGAVNIKGWVLEARGDYLERNDTPWQRNDVRLVHDWPEKMVRFVAGDLSYPVSNFQSYQPLLGVSVARNFSLQPYRVTEPTGQTSFVLQSPSRVDILVNGQRVRTLQLAPGPYDISDFPIVDGSNDVTLLITDATGNTEEKTFSLLSHQNLLKAGLHEYAYNIGVRARTQDRHIQYEEDRPALSAFHRYGISDTLTGGFSLQGDSDIQQAGLSAVKAHEWGTLGLETSLSRADSAGEDLAAQLSYSYQDTTDKKNFAASLEYRGEDFISLGQDTPLNPAAWQAAARYNQALAYNINMGVGGRYLFGRGAEEDDWSYSANFNRVLSSALSLNVNWQQQRREGAGVFVGLTWTPQKSDHTVSASVDTLTKTRDARWDWYKNWRWQGGAGVTEEDGDLRGTGNISYTGQRAEASLRHDINRFQIPGTADLHQLDQRSQMRLGTALAFADGHFALSRPINESFLLLTRHKNLNSYPIGINPESEGAKTPDYQAEINAAGPAVIPDTVPYMYRPVRVDTRNLPPGYDVGQSNFIGLPSYKSGTVMSVGSAANIYADGYMMLNPETPIALQGGLISNLDDPDFPEQEFFTNRKGRFRISRLQAGRYRMTLYAYPEKPVFLTIPENSPTGRYDAQTLILSEEIS